MKTSIISLLTNSTAEKSVLSKRLVSDLFHALDYDNILLDIRKNGREISIEGRHRHKPLVILAEFNTYVHSIKVGGKEWELFLKTVEKARKSAVENREVVAAYYIALGGFSQAKNQDSVVMLDSEQVVRRLEEHRLLVNDSAAVALAEQCLQAAKVYGLKYGLMIDGIKLFSHKLGYVKAVYFSQNSQRSHYALIHADGHILTESIARTIIADDEQENGVLYSLHYLAPPQPTQDYRLMAEGVMSHYRKWLSEECGSIQLDGLPTDSDLGPRKLELERLFVPLNVILPEEATESKDLPFPEQPKARPIGQLLTEAAHIAILASPGGGKSTLLKRLAIAYALPERRLEIDDNLPERNWIPIFLRCRDLQHKASSSILSILEDIPVRAGMSKAEALVFQQLIQEELQAGRVLLLVDGLDEISQENARIAFVNNLRSFLAIFPQTALIVTSREAGFRLVAGTIASMCRNVRLAPFSQADIRTLCVSWLTQVENDTIQVREGALKLANDIWQSERIRALAENPLLLTTLLVVKRWIGELPRNRAALYGVAVQVLVRTWNVEGFAPMDEQETLAQLSYVACAMMEQGIQRISYNALLKLLQEAHQELDAELQFVTVSPAQFIERVESRSSLLMQTGQVMEDGELQPVYEFRHLTFQEYSAARGYAKEQHPHRNNDVPFADLLAPHFNDERWWEVIPLAVVMAERRATEATIKKLIELSANPGTTQKEAYKNRVYIQLLMNCILDEVKLTSNTLIAAIKTLGLYGNYGVVASHDAERLMSSKVGEIFVSTIEQEFFSAQGNWAAYSSVIGDINSIRFDYRDQESANDFVEDAISKLSISTREDRIRTTLQLMHFLFFNRRELEGNARKRNSPLTMKEPIIKLRKNQISKLYSSLNNMLTSGDWPTILAASWALAWGGLGLLYHYPANQQAVELLLQLWNEAPSGDVEGFIVWAFASSNLLSRDALTGLLQDTEWDKLIVDRFDQEPDWNRDKAIQRAAVALAWYRRSPWSDEELALKIKEAYSFGSADDLRRSIRDQERAFTMLAALGEVGEQVIAQQKLFILEVIRERDKVENTRVS